MALRRGACAVVVALVAAGGCKKRADHHAAGSARASSSASKRPPDLPRAFCRVITASGTVRRGSTPLSVGTRVDGRDWLVLEPGAKLSLRHSLSSREVTLVGPARALACPHGEEQMVLAAGELRSATGLGARPGAEVLVATPLGSVRYGDAQLDVKVTKTRVDVKVEAGDAWVEPIAPAHRTGPEHVKGTQSAHLSSASAVSADRAVTTCRRAAERAARLAQQVLAPSREGGGGSLGARAAKDVRAREAARLACASAGAAVGLIADPAKRRELWALLERSDRLWRQVPPTRSGSHE